MARIPWPNATINKLFFCCLLSVWALLSTACEDDSKPNTTTLKRPSDFVQSGRGLAKGQPEYVFIADSALDFVTALNATFTYDDLEYVWAPTFYFPMMIPAGPMPTALSTTHDGRLVLVASGQLGTIQLLDTGTMRMLLSDNHPEQLLSFKVVDDNGSIFQLLHLAECGDRCDSYMAVATDMMVKFTLNYSIDSEDMIVSPEITLEDVYPVGDSVIRATYVAATKQLWLAQNSGDKILRLDVDSGELSWFDVGGGQQDITLNPNGDVLFVANSSKREISIFSGADGNILTHVENDNIFMPADAGSDASELFMRDIPWRLLYSTEPALTITCISGDGGNVNTKQKFDEYLLVASLRGVVYYFVPDDSNTDSAGPHFKIADANFCKPQGVTIDNAVDGNSWWLKTCEKSTRPGICDEESGVLVYPGYRTLATDTTYKIIYEADITMGTGGLGRGQIDEQGHFWVDSTIFTPGSFFLKTKSADWAGDRLVITSTPDSKPADCRTRYGEANEINKRSFTLVGKDENGHYVTDPKIDPECFDLGKKGLYYEIQATDSFYILGQANNTTSQDWVRMGRLKAGQTFGPGGDTAKTAGIRFTIKENTCAAGSCQQGQAVAFKVEDYFSPMRGAYFSGSSALPTIGTVPVEMRVGHLLGTVDGEYAYVPVLMMLYGGTGAQTAPGLILTPSFDSSELLSSTYYYFFD